MLGSEQQLKKRRQEERLEWQLEQSPQDPR